MIWVIAIICLTLSCEPTPKVIGQFESEGECLLTVSQIAASWHPDIGGYHIGCEMRRIA